MSYAQTMPNTDDRTLDEELARIEQLAKTLDARFRIPGTPIRFGLDTLVGLVPGVDYVIGSIPLLGDVFDIAFKANLRNTRILRQELERQRPLAIAGPRA